MKIIDSLAELAARVGWADEQTGRKVADTLTRVGTLLDTLPASLADNVAELREDVTVVARDFTGLAASVAELRRDLAAVRVELAALVAGTADTVAGADVDQAASEPVPAKASRTRKTGG